MRLEDFEAVLFDMDGTLLDSEPLWHQAEIDLFARYGVPWSTQQALTLTGLNLPAVAEFMRGKGVDLPAADVIAALGASVRAGLASSVDLHEDVIGVLRRARASGMPTALVTMSTRDVVDAALPAIGADAFDVVLAGEDVERGKPDPEPYLKAAGLLGKAPSDCLVIEDSRVGIAAGLAAGCTVLSVGPLAGQIDGVPALAEALTL